MSFYGLIWRVLPGPKAVKVIEALVLIGLVLFFLFNWVFPAIADYMPFNNVTVDE
jgi:hypothetical protein